MGLPKRRFLLAYVPAAVAIAHKRRDIGLGPGVALVSAYAAPVAVRAALPAGRLRTVATWAAHMWAYKTAFEVPYDRPGELRARLRIDEPIQRDTRLGAGVPSPQRLQRALRRPPRLNALDYGLTAIYAAWLAEPHAAIGWILMRHPRRFASAALRLGATYDLSLLGYFLAPTAPPWWASEREGRMGRDVRRVAPEVAKALRGQPRPGTDHNSGANPWAAVPSDHFATAVTVAILLAEADARAGALGAAYAVLLGFALVYLGEHYVSDLLAGAGLALAVNVAPG